MARRIFLYTALTAALLFVLAPHGSIAGAKSRSDGGPVRNVIMMVPDGCSQSVQTLARWLKGESLNLDGLNTGTVITYMADSVVTDSAAAATAFATGHKTSGGFLSVGPAIETLLTGLVPTAEPFAPVATVLEAAKLRGLSTGLVATSRISHATPAAFAAHVHDRGLENDIMEQMVYQDIDVVFGGGGRNLVPIGDTYATFSGGRWKGRRTDGENLIDVLKARGYAFVDNGNDMAALKSGRAWGIFADSHMDPDIDRDDLHPDQPSLAAMTEKAIELLSENPRGFFLMVEGSQIDWAGHANDPAYMATEFLAFDRAVGRAVFFAEKDRHTLVLIFPDHNTGALSLGHRQSDFPPPYTATTIETLVDPIRDAEVTLRTLLGRLPEKATADDVKAAFAVGWGPYWKDRLSEQDAAAIAAHAGDVGDVGERISRNYTVFGWTSHGHTGEDVPLWSFGPGRPVGTFDNTALAKIAADALGIDLAGASCRLFVNAAAPFPQFRVDRTDPANPVVIIDGCSLPVGKDLVIGKDDKRPMDGIVVFAPEIDRTFIPLEAVHLLRQQQQAP